MNKNLHNTHSNWPMPSLANHLSTERGSKYDHAKLIIGRFDHYYDGVNNKSAFYIALNTFIFGGICVGYLSLYNKVNTDLVLWIFFGALVISNALSILFTVMAIKP